MGEAAVLVTGGGRRVGAAIVRALHAAGARLVVHCHRSHADAERLVAELERIRPGSAAVVKADLLDVAGLPALVESAAACFGRLDGLVNNASSFLATPLGTIGPREWEDLVGTNLRAPLLLSQSAAPHLKRSGGSIVNIIDIHAGRPLKDHVVYSVAKSGLAGLTRSLALELAPRVRVNAVSPGAILWPEDGNHFPASEQARITSQTPLGRIGRPEDIALAVRYFLFDAPYVTGQVLAVDGGRSIFL
jgi:pteridine reductase